MEVLPQAGLWGMLSQATLTVKIVLIILGLMSVASWSLIFMKYFTLTSARKDAARDYRALQESESLKHAMRTLNHHKKSPAYFVGMQAFEELLRMEESDLDKTEKAKVAMDNIRRVLRQAVTSEIGRLSKSLAFLASTANSAPFIGLFGTVWGIMHSFHAVGQMKTAALAAVAPGISEALVATAIGLAVAIPATLGYNFFLGYLQDVERELINFASEFLNRVQREVSWDYDDEDDRERRPKATRPSSLDVNSPRRSPNDIRLRSGV